MKRWHTFPPAVKEEPPAIRPLDELIKAPAGAVSSSTPFYQLLRTTAASPALAADEKRWLTNSVLPSFDVYVANVLRSTRFEAWDRDYQLRSEYSAFYGAGEAVPSSLYAVMGRLLTRAEIEREIASTAGACEQGVRPIWSSPPAGRAARKTQERRYVVSSHKQRLHLMEPATLKGAPFDPRHRWGIMCAEWEAPMRSLGLADSAPLRMACCMEYLDYSEGCWIALSSDPSAIEGEIKEYTVFAGLIDWLALANGRAVPDANAWSAAIVRGTAFQDVDHYEALDARISQLVATLAPKMERATKHYLDNVLQAEIDAMRGENDSLTLTLDAYKHMLPLAPELPLLVQELYKFNAIQMRPQSTASAATYVNERIMHTADLAAHWTYEKRAGLLLAKTGVRLRAPRGAPFASPKQIRDFVAYIDDERGQHSPAEFVAAYKNLEAVRDMVNNSLLPVATFYQREDNEEAWQLVQAMEEKIASNGLDRKDAVPAPLYAQHANARSMAASQQAFISTALNEIRNKRDAASALLAQTAAVPQRFASLSELRNLEDAIDSRILVNEALTSASAAAEVKTTSSLYTLYTTLARLPQRKVPRTVDAGIRQLYATQRAVAESALKAEIARILLLAGQEAYIAARKGTLQRVDAVFAAVVAQTRPAIEQGIAAAQAKEKAAWTALEQGLAAYVAQQKAAARAARTQLVPLAAVVATGAGPIATAVQAQKTQLLAMTDTLNQVALAANVRKTLRDTLSAIVLPTAELLQTSVTAGHTPADYLAAWNGSVRQAAAALLQALEALLTAIGGDPLNAPVSQDAAQRAQQVAEAATRAYNVLETPQARGARLQAERDARAQLVRPGFDAWLRSASLKQLVEESPKGLAALAPLWPGQVLRIFTASELGQAKTADWQLAPKSAYFADKTAAEIAALWSAFRDSLVAGVAAPPLPWAGIEQPTAILRVDSVQAVKAPTAPLRTYADYARVGIKGMTTSKTIDWIDNSCWIDAPFMALFSLPETAVTKAIHTANSIVVKQDQLIFPIGLPRVISCVDKAADLHAALLSDIDFVQNPLPTTDNTRVCATRPFWRERCVANPAKTYDATLDATDTFQMLYHFYFDAKTTPELSVVVDLEPSGTTPCIVQLKQAIASQPISYFDQGALKPAPPRLKWNNSQTHEVVAIVYGLYIYEGAPNERPVLSHYIAHTRDPLLGTWTLFDKRAGLSKVRTLNATEVANQNLVIDAYDVRLQGVDYVQYRIPAAVVWFSKTEVARLVGLRKAQAQAAPVLPQPQPQAGDAIPREIFQQSPALAAALGIDATTTTLSRVDGVRNTVFVGHLDDGAAAPRLVAYKTALAVAADPAMPAAQKEEIVAQQLMRAQLYDYGTPSVRAIDAWDPEMQSINIRYLPATEPDRGRVLTLLAYVRSEQDAARLQEELARVGMQTNLADYY